MIIPNNGLITLDYNPATDVLSMALPDMREYSLSEVERSLQLVVETINNYDVKHLFLDSSKAFIEVNDEAYRKVVMKFSMDLKKTRLKKLARIGSSSASQEQKAAKVAEEISHSGSLPVEFQNFATKAEAMQWLVEKS